MPRFQRMRRSFVPRPLRKTYKKVLNFAASSHAAGTKVDIFMAVGVDSIAIGQLTPTDGNVPTGARITSFVIQYAAQNLALTPAFVHLTIQHLHSGQGTIDPRVIGGNPQRNQVFNQQLRSIGLQQNFNYVKAFKVPKKFQRVREGDSWSFTYFLDQVVSDIVQIIYTVEL